jgi:hypothetical protein
MIEGSGELGNAKCVVKVVVWDSFVAFTHGADKCFERDGIDSNAVKVEKMAQEAKEHISQRLHLVGHRAHVELKVKHCLVVQCVGLR